MALKDKLGALTQKIETEKQIQAQKKEEIELIPIRENVIKLSKEKKNLEVIKGSLEFKDLNNPANHEGMQDYASNTEKKIKTEETVLENLIEEHKEALAGVGVENKDQLMANPEYSDEEEVVNYKKALERGEGLKMSDAKLKERLKSYGIELDYDKFSYEAASRAVEERLKVVTPELINEKLKTPEGREEIIKGVAKEFEENTAKLNLDSVSSRGKSMDSDYNSGQPEHSYGFEMDRNSFRIDFEKEKATVNGWSGLKLVPNNFKDVEVIYGKEIAHEALERAYQDKIHDSFSRLDKGSDNASSLAKQIKAVSPEEKRAAQNKLNEFTKKQNEVLQILQEKSEELKAKGIEFSPEYASGYGTKYKELIDLDSSGSMQYISENLNNNDFPPQHDFIKLSDAIDKRLEQLDQFMEVIKNIKNEADVENLLKKTDSDVYVGKIHKKQLKANFREDIQFKLEGDNSNSVNKLLNNCKTYEQAKNYLNEIIKNNSEGESNVSEVIINVLNLHLKKSELEQEMKDAGMGGHIYNLENKVREISQRKTAAIKVMGVIESLISKLSSYPETVDENLKLSRKYLVIPSLAKEYDDLRKNIPLKEKAWEEKKRERDKQEKAEPKIFGKEKWSNKLTELKNEEAAIKNEYDELVKKDQIEMYHKAYHFVESDQYDDIGKMVEKYTAQGNISQIFNDLKEELTKVIDTSLPPKILKDYEEYNALVEKIK